MRSPKGWLKEGHEVHWFEMKWGDGVVIGGENKDEGFMEFSNQTMLGELHRRVHADERSIKELKKMWSENCRRTMKGYDPHEPTTIGEPGLLCVICLALRIEDCGNGYLETGFGDFGGCG